MLSQAWGKKVTKSNFRSLIKRQLNSVSDSGAEKAETSPGNLIKSENKDFVSRQNAIATLQDLVARGNKIIVLQGGGVGKTT